MVCTVKVMYTEILLGALYITSNKLRTRYNDVTHMLYEYCDRYYIFPHPLSLRLFISVVTKIVINELFDCEKRNKKRRRVGWQTEKRGSNDFVSDSL